MSIRELLDAVPFRPFTIRPADRQYFVPRPEYVSLGPGESLVVWLEDG